ncbi:MAG: phage holin family protein [Bdellovibrionales bacterium]
MSVDNIPRSEVETQSLGSVMKEIGNSAKDLIQSEVSLFKVELKSTAQIAVRHAIQLFMFGLLLVLSVFPMIAFLVIALGRALEDRYWLSSLIVAVVFAGVGGLLAYRAYKKLKDVDFTLPRTKAALNTEISSAQKKFDEVKSAAKGERHESPTIH